MIFGTDGVRGFVDKEINFKLAYDIGKGFAIYIRKRKLNPHVVIGKDTRISSDLYLSAITCGLVDFGIDVDVVDVVSTPMISFFVHNNQEYSGGVMITASHNDFRYNGIKLFNSYGIKLNNKDENEVERNILINSYKTKNKGKISLNINIKNIYIENLINTFNFDLSNKLIIIDSANGSNFDIAPQIYESLGAKVIRIGCKNDGKNINKKCGANYISLLQKEVILHDADLGIAFDGDGDRLRVVLKGGKILSGDDLLYLFGLYLKKYNKLNFNKIVGTIMTSLGFEDALIRNNMSLIRSDVGDKNVINLMNNNSINLGGESSGHICVLDYLPTCDALYNSLFFIKCYEDLCVNKSINEIVDENIKYPSILLNVEVDVEFKKMFNKNINLKNKIKKLQLKYPDIKILVRPSGTESVIRIYIESEDSYKNNFILNILKKLIKSK